MENLEQFKFSAFLKKELEGYHYSRTQSQCSFSSVCGSCPLSHIPYKLQLSIKEKYVQELLKRTQIEDSVISNIKIIPSIPNSHYRNRMDYSVNFDGHLGLKERGSWYKIVPHNKCFLAVPAIENAFDLVEYAFNKNKVHGYDRRDHKGFVSFVVIRGNAEKSVSINFVIRIDSIDKMSAVQLQKEFLNWFFAVKDMFFLESAYGVDVKGVSLVVTNSAREESTGEVILTITQHTGIPATHQSANSSRSSDLMASYLDMDCINSLTNHNVKKKLIILFDQLFKEVGLRNNFWFSKINSCDLSDTMPIVPVVIYGVTYKLFPFSFFQPNLYTAGILQKLVMQGVQNLLAIKSGEGVKNIQQDSILKYKILDLFGGQGFLGGFINKRLGIPVDVVEIDRHAVFTGYRLWSRYLSSVGIQQQTTINLTDDLNILGTGAGSIGQGVYSFNMILADAYTYKIPDVYDLIILDPPRRGLTKKLLKQIINLKRLKGLVYVSCNIKQFAIEYVKHLNQIFRVRNVTILDQFPHTEHVEVVLELQRYS